MTVRSHFKHRTVFITVVTHGLTDWLIGWLGMQADGSVVVWDVHESSALNESYTDSNGNEYQLRQPTYNTG